MTAAGFAVDFSSRFHPTVAPSTLVSPSSNTFVEIHLTEPGQRSEDEAQLGI
jgi:hypothetical protein